MSSSILTSLQAIGTFKATAGFQILHTNLSLAEAKAIAEVTYETVKKGMSSGALPSGTAVLVVDAAKLEEITPAEFYPSQHSQVVTLQFGTY